MRKRFFAILMALCMALTLLPGTVLAADNTPTSGKCGDDVTWFLANDGTLVLNGSGPTYDYGYYDGWGDDRRFTPWNDLIDQIKYIKIQGKITYLGGYLFKNCRYVRGITLPSTLEGMAWYALPDPGYGNLEYFISERGGKYTAREGVLYRDWGATLLMYPPALKTSSATFTLPETVTKIDDFFGYAFCHNKYLERVILNDKIKEIPSYAFEHCLSLKEVVIPSNVTQISGCAFCRCPTLEKVEIPSSVTEIDFSTFWFCDQLSSVVIPASIRKVTAGWSNGDGSVIDFSTHKDFYFCGDAPIFDFSDEYLSMGHDDNGWGAYIRTDIYYPAGAEGWPSVVQRFEGLEGVRFYPYGPNDDGQLHGKISVSGVYNAEGEQVTLSVTPDPGYQLDSITVAEDGGNRQVYVSGSGNTYTFAMPAYDVTVQAEFTKIR